MVIVIAALIFSILCLQIQIGILKKTQVLHTSFDRVQIDINGMTSEIFDNINRDSDNIKEGL